MKRFLIPLALALGLAGCGGGGASGTSLAGSYTGAWSQAPALSGAAALTVAGSGAVAGSLTGTLTVGQTQSEDFAGTYNGIPVTGSFWATAKGIEGSVAPMGGTPLTVFTLTRN
jgi:hypothetical protein